MVLSSKTGTKGQIIVDRIQSPYSSAIQRSVILAPPTCCTCCSCCCCCCSYAVPEGLIISKLYKKKQLQRNDKYGEVLNKSNSSQKNYKRYYAERDIRRYQIGYTSLALLICYTIAIVVLGGLWLIYLSGILDR